MDPTSAGSAILIKYGAVIAGFVGAILSLSFLKNLTRTSAFVAVAVGFFSAFFLTDFVIAYFELRGGNDARNGVAFLIGLMAMNLIPLGKSIAESIFGLRGTEQ